MILYDRVSSHSLAYLLRTPIRASPSSSRSSDVPVSQESKVALVVCRLISLSTSGQRSSSFWLVPYSPLSFFRRWVLSCSCSPLRSWRCFSHSASFRASSSASLCRSSRDESWWGLIVSLDGSDQASSGVLNWTATSFCLDLPLKKLDLLFNVCGGEFGC